MHLQIQNTYFTKNVTYGHYIIAYDNLLAWRWEKHLGQYIRSIISLKKKEESFYLNQSCDYGSKNIKEEI